MGTGGPVIPWKITSYMGFYREKAIEPHLEKVWHPLPLEYGGPPLSGTFETDRIPLKFLDLRMIDADLGGHFM